MAFYNSRGQAVQTGGTGVRYSGGKRTAANAFINPHVMFNIADCNWFETKRVLQVPPMIAAVRKAEIFHHADHVSIYNTQTNTEVRFKFSDIENNGNRYVFTNVERALIVWVDVA